MEESYCLVLGGFQVKIITKFVIQKSRNERFLNNERSDKIKNLKKKKEIGIKTLTAAPYSFKNL